MIFSFYESVILFFIYSFLGWCVEVAFVAVTTGKVVNRGFLNGPVCPIYGFGMLGVLMALIPIENNIILLFLGGILICSVIELFGGWILDKIFHMRWWDYSDNKFNIGGYVCLAFSIMWGMAVVFAVKFVHHPIMAGVKKIPNSVKLIIIIVLSVIFIIDMIVTLKNLIGIKQSLGQLDKVAEELHNVGDQLKDVVGNSAIIATEVGKEKIVSATEAGKEKLVSATEVGKEKIVSATEVGKEKIISATEAGKEKFVLATEEQREKFAKQIQELEMKKDALIDNIQKRGKHTLNSFVTLNKSGKRINIKEYLKETRNKKSDKGE